MNNRNYFQGATRRIAGLSGISGERIYDAACQVKINDRREDATGEVGMWNIGSDFTGLS
jgi:hypothetical protein